MQPAEACSAAGVSCSSCSCNYVRGPRHREWNVCPFSPYSSFASSIRSPAALSLSSLSYPIPLSPSHILILSVAGDPADFLRNGGLMSEHRGIPRRWGCTLLRFETRYHANSGDFVCDAISDMKRDLWGFLDVWGWMELIGRWAFLNVMMGETRWWCSLRLWNEGN